ncbi:transcriptional regulator, LysR family [Duganella sp. CF402]|uniref:LysR family transcriptional regulator n=1 Tax=unclassified Duganella TaxID=2636909 RepID=UPI0008B86AC5|nr:MULTISPECIES: LysR family transcriptional regulator [unclassified Duganella]RZT08151.1 LysR family transcriptional regulator [Duganella sp. BK701]SEM03846.1 transcriptional regulator, LysR family [Duganella sp. CF402]
MKQINISKIDLNVLKIFEALYEEGGASRAGLRLAITQSAVSAALNRLRTIYGDQLFTRTGRGLAPTSRAHELKPIISDALNKFRQSLGMGSHGESGYLGRSVLIGMSDDYEIAIGKVLLNAINKRMPGLRLALRQTHSQIALEMVMRRETDLTITSGGLSSPLVSREALGEGGYACLIDPGSANTKSKALDLGGYLDRKHILISSGGFIGVVDEVLAALGHQRHVLASTTHFSALPFLLKGTDAVATMPTHAAHQIAQMTGLKMVRCPVSMPRYPIELGWLKSALRDPIVAEVKTIAMELLAKKNWNKFG